MEFERLYKSLSSTRLLTNNSVFVDEIMTYYYVSPTR